MKKEIIISSVCKINNCPEYIEWNFGFDSCRSCKLLGQSYDISEFPDKCNYIKEINDYIKIKNIEL